MSEVAVESGKQSRRPLLLIEDDDDIRETISMLLEINGFSVVSARHGREGLMLLDECEDLGLILLDWMMPIMSGGEFLRAKGLRSECRDIPVVVLTAFGGRDPEIPADHLMKPVSADLLLSTVQRHCAA